MACHDSVSMMVSMSCHDSVSIACHDGAFMMVFQLVYLGDHAYVSPEWKVGCLLFVDFTDDKGGLEVKKGGGGGGGGGCILVSKKLQQVSWFLRQHRRYVGF